MIRSVAVAAIAFWLSGCAGATPPPPPNPDFTCSFTHPSKSVDSLRRLPAPIRRALRDLAGEMADRGKFFNNGDVVVKPAPFQRYIRGGEIGERWFVWYEHGGIAYWKQIVLFGSDPSGTPHVIAQARATGDLCSQTDRLLGGQTR